MRTLIVGPGGSGKDTLRKRFEGRGARSAVFSTTRPARDGEVHGSDYNFVDEAFFNTHTWMIQEQYGPWMYGLSLRDFYSCDVAIFTPVYLSKLSREFRAGCLVIYLDVEESVRRTRLSQRFDADDLERRIKSDRDQFAGFTDFDVRITDPFF